MTLPVPEEEEYRDFLATSIEKALNAVPRAEELSPKFLTLPKDVQLETERRNRKIGRRAADFVIEKLRNAGYLSGKGEAPEHVMETILRAAIEQAQRELRRADDVEPEEAHRSR